jgi:hypothetical protein
MHYPLEHTPLAVLTLGGKDARQFVDFAIIGPKDSSTVSTVACGDAIVVQRAPNQTHRITVIRGVTVHSLDSQSAEQPDGWPLSPRVWSRVAAVFARDEAHFHVFSPVDTAKDVGRHEDELVNHRLGWFVSSQGLLFASLAFAWKDAKHLVLIIAVLGFLLSLSALWASICSNRSYYLAELRDPSTPGFSVIQAYPRFGRWLMWLFPWNAFPALFICSWIAMVSICVHRYLAPSAYDAGPTEVRLVPPVVPAPATPPPASPSVTPPAKQP